MSNYKIHFKTFQERVEAMIDIAENYAVTQTAQELADKYGVPIHMVSSWASQMRAVGLDIPRVTSFGTYLEVIRRLHTKKSKLLTKKALENLA